MKERKGPSLEPQKVSSLVWYCESRGSIQIYLDASMVALAARQQRGINFNIRKSALVKSLKRMNYRRRKP